MAATLNCAPMLASSIRRITLAIAISTLAMGLALARFCPNTVISRGLITGQIGNISRLPMLVSQLRDPLVFLRTPAGDETTNALRWRILVPAAAHLLRLRPYFLILLPRFGAGMLMGACTIALYRLTGDWLRTFLGAVLVAVSSSFLVGADWISLDPCFLLLAVAVVFARTPALALLASLAAPWADERFVLFAIPFVLLRQAIHPAKRPFMLGLLVGCAAYLAVRSAAFLHGEASLQTQISICAKWHYPILRGWFFAFGVGWLVALAGMYGCGRDLWTSARDLGVLFAASLAAGFCADAFLAADTTRSIAVCLPFLLMGVSKVPRGALVAAAAAALLLPTGYYVAEQHLFYHPCLCW